MFGQINAAWYDDHVRFYTRIALGILAEKPEISDDALAGEVHEWLNAPDSMLQTWTNDGEDALRALSIIEHSQHPATPTLPEGNPDPDFPDSITDDYLSRVQYIAAHVVVRDVMGRIGRIYTMPADLSSPASPPR